MKNWARSTGALLVVAGVLAVLAGLALASDDGARAQQQPSCDDLASACTELSGPVQADTRLLLVESTSGFAQGDNICIDSNADTDCADTGDQEETGVIAGIATAQFALSADLSFDHPAGALIHLIPCVEVIQTPTPSPTPTATPTPLTYHITVDMVADGAPGNIQSSREVSGPFTIEIEVGDDFSLPDYADGLQFFWFTLDYPEDLIVPADVSWTINSGYVSTCYSNAADGSGMAPLYCDTATADGEGPVGPAWVASLTFNTIEGACGQGVLALGGFEGEPGPTPALWGNDWLFEPLTLNDSQVVVDCPSTPTPTPTATTTPTPTPTSSPTPTPTPTATPSPTPTLSPTSAGTPTATPTATPVPTGTPTMAPETATPLPTLTPSPTPTPYGGAAPGARGPVALPVTGGGVAAGDGSPLGWSSLAALVLALAAACAAGVATVKSRRQ